MIIRKSVDNTISQFTKKITSQTYSVDKYGINWIYNRNNKIVLYYESGETESRGIPQLLKSYFLGYYKTDKDVTTMTGIIISGPIIQGFIFLALLFECIFLGFNEFLYSCIFYLPILIWIYFGEKKNRKSILNYIDMLLK